MDFLEGRIVCPNSDHGCGFVASSRAESFNHFQNDCQFHAVECFKCKRKVRRIHFAKHYTESCRSSSPLWYIGLQTEDALEETGLRGEDKHVPHNEQLFQVRSTRWQLENEKFSCAMEGVQGKVRDARAVFDKQVLDRQVEASKEVTSGNQCHLHPEMKNDGQADQDPAKMTRTWECDTRRQECTRECDTRQSSKTEISSSITEDVQGPVKDAEATAGRQTDPEPAVDGLSETRCHLLEKVNSDVQEVQKLVKGVPQIMKSLERVDDLVKEVAALTRSVEQLKEGMKRYPYRMPASSSGGGWIKCVNGNEAFWIIEYISECIGKSSGSAACKTSGIFALRGYSAKLQVEVEDHENNLWIGVYLRLCQGPNDSQLQWPFDIPYTLSLIHPEDDSKNKTYNLKPPSEYPESFRKPQSEGNPGCGGYLCTLQHAKDGGFIEGDAICVAVTLHHEG